MSRVIVITPVSSMDDQVTRDIHGSSLDVHIFPMPHLSEHLWMTKLLGISMDGHVTRDIHGSSMDVHIFPMSHLSEHLWMIKLLGISMDDHVTRDIHGSSLDIPSSFVNHEYSDRGDMGVCVHP